MRTTPNAENYGELLRGEAVNNDLIQSRDERARLRSAIAAGDQATDQLVELEGLHDELLALAQDAYTEVRSGYEVAHDKLETYDAESERVLAETGGRVRSLDARIRHARTGSCARAEAAAPDLALLEAELATAQLADSQRITERLSGREWLARECRALRMAVLTAGQARLALSSTYVPALRTIQQAGRAALERHRELLQRSESAGQREVDQLHVLRVVTPRTAVALRQGEPDVGGACVHRDRNGGAPSC